MTSRRGEAALPLADSPLPEEELAALVRLLRWAHGFVLVFVRSNVPVESRWIVDRLAERLSGEGLRVRDLFLRAATDDLLVEIRAVAPPPASGEAVVVVGFEHSIPSRIPHPPALDRLNRSRERFRELPCPLVLVLPDYALNQLAREAPDFWAWRSGVFATRPAKSRPPIEPQELNSRQSELWSLSLERKKDHLEAVQELLAKLEGSTANNDTEKSHLCWRISVLQRSLGELDDAILYARKALEHAGGDASMNALALSQIADICQLRGELEEALRIRQEEMLPVYERLGDARGRAITLGKIADIYHARGEHDEALRIRQEESLPVYEKLGDVRERAISLGKIADVYQARGDFDNALRIHQEEELPVYEILGDVRERAVALGKIADIYQARGDLDGALRLRLEELRVFRDLGEPRENARALWRIAQIELQRQETCSAVKRLSEAYEIFVRLGTPDGIALVGLDLAQRHVSLGQTKKARALLLRSREGFAKLGWAAELEEAESLLAQLPASEEGDQGSERKEGPQVEPT